MLFYNHFINYLLDGHFIGAPLKFKTPKVRNYVTLNDIHAKIEICDIRGHKMRGKVKKLIPAGFFKLKKNSFLEKNMPGLICFDKPMRILIYTLIR